MGLLDYGLVVAKYGPLSFLRYCALLDKLSKMSPRQTNCGQSCVLSISSKVGLNQRCVKDCSIQSNKHIHWSIHDLCNADVCILKVEHQSCFIESMDPGSQNHQPLKIETHRPYHIYIYIAPEFLTEGNTLLPRFFSWPS